MPLKAWWDRVLTSEVRAWPLARTRIVIGVLAFIRAAEGGRVLWKLTTPDTLRLPFVAGMPEMSRAEVPWLVGIWMAAAVAFTAGWRTRSAGVVLVLAMLRVLTGDQQAYSSHLYLMLLLVLILTVADSSATASLDARRVGSRAWIPAWPVWLLAVQGSLVYGLAAATKLIPEYLSGAVLCFHLGWLHWSSPPVMLCAGLAIASVLTELFLAVGLWSRRFWGVACVAGLGLHALMIFLLAMQVRLQLVIFAGEMLVLYPLYPIATAMLKPAGAANIDTAVA